MKKTTQEILEGDDNAIKQKDGWQDFISDDILFDGTGVKATGGKDAFVEGNRQFLRAVRASQVKEMIVDGEKACALLHYDLMSRKGNTASSDVAEILTIKKENCIGHYLL